MPVPRGKSAARNLRKASKPVASLLRRKMKRKSGKLGEKHNGKKTEK